MCDIITYIYIAGAHSRARTLRKYIESLHHGTRVLAFLVDDMAENSEYVDGIPVKLINCVSGLNTECRVYIGTRGANHERLIKELECVGFKDIVPLTVELDRSLRKEYVEKFYKKTGKKFCMIGSMQDDYCENNIEEGKASNKIYVANSAFDKPLHNIYVLEPYEICIQVGSALTDIRLDGVVYDCDGDNISEKNRQYCELTGLYWIWKNAVEDYVGLAHYRRHFILPENWCELMERHHIDVILPVPLYVSPNLADNFRERHAAREWDCMIDYLKKNMYDDYEKAEAFFKGNLYSPCNMLIASRGVLNKLCEWMFPILDAVVAKCGQEGDKYENRYPGFLSERLISYYFNTRESEINVVYADKNFLI